MTKQHYFPLAGQKQLMRLLGPYLAECVDIFHPASGQYGRLKGLPFSHAHQEQPVADVEMYVSDECREEGGGDLTEPYSRILPVLYSFTGHEDEAAEYGIVASADVVEAGALPEADCIVLRSLHIAVGLQPHQYKRRVVGFDYTTGLKPHHILSDWV